jgi:class 3 adenylate cyclase
MSVRVTAWQAPDEYPRVVQLAPFIPPDAFGDVRRDDRLIEVGSTHMRGAQGLEAVAAFRRASWDRDEVPIVVERDGRRSTVGVRPVFLSLLAPLMVTSPIFVAFAVLILLKAPRSRPARAIFHFLLTAGLFLTSYLVSGHGLVPWLGIAVFTLSSVAIGPVAMRALLLFPNGAPPDPRWLRWLPLPYVLVGLTTTANVMGFPYSVYYAEQIAGTVQMIAVATLLALLARLYRRSDPQGRRRLKWSVLGLYLAGVPSVVGAALIAVGAEYIHATVWLQVSLGLVAPFAYLALYRHDAFDVDRLLSGTFAFNVVLAALVAAWVLLAPRLGEWMSQWLDMPATAGQLIVSVGLAAVAVPVQRRLKPRLDAIFFAAQHDRERSLEALRDELGQAEDAKALLRRLGRELYERMRPESIVIYGRDGDHYAALVVHGRGVPAELPADGPVAATLRERRGPICVDGQLAGPADRSGDAFARAALEVLNAALVLPIEGVDDAPPTFVCLGPKRSGDLYTPTEVHLLRAVVDRAALELRGFDERAMRAETREMQAAMRQYVPGTVAEHIEQGDELAAGEREVTVLFVDLRGFVSLSEQSDAAEIFSTVNRYTMLVSELVRERGGTVVEFNGDGMMAVFGAPGDLRDRERAAVRAALRIAEDVEALDHEGRPLTVGIGVASGPDFVGNIQAADRLIWSAIGNTTNLAARLQALTREFEIPILIDAATYAALDRTAVRFRRYEQVAVRGLRDRIDVYGLRASSSRHPVGDPSPREVARAALRLSGAVWSVTFADRTVELPDAKGLHYLSRLLASPGQDLHVLDLVTEVEGVSARASASVTPQDTSTVRAGNAGGDEVLDDAARSAYRARLEELRQDLEDAETAHDLGRIDRTREEMAFLESELLGATGLGGRARRTSSDEERARKAVYNRIQHVTRRMESLHPELAAHLKASIRTGVTCRYQPEHEVAWILG